MGRTGITFFQTCMITMMSIGLMNHVIVIPLLLSASGRDAWIAVIASALPYLLWLAMLYAIIRITHRQPMISIIGTVCGKWGMRLAGIVFSVYLLLQCIVTMRDTINWMHLSFAPNTPMVVLAFVFGALCFINAHAGIKSIAMTSGIFLPFVVLFGFFVMSANFQHKDYAYLKPFLADGLQPLWPGMVFAGAGFTETIVLLFIQHHVRGKVTYPRLALLAIILVILTLGPTVGAIAEFGPAEAANLRYPAFEEWRLVTIGLYIEHVDFLSIYQWLTGAFIRVSILLNVLMELTGQLQQPIKWRWVGTLFVIVIALTLWQLSDIEFIRLLTLYVMPVFLIFSVLFSIFLLIVALYARRKEKRRTEA
ncbi:MAG: GerAB/ArcD/ProY family transporter [Clostridia bacterium]